MLDHRFSDVVGFDPSAESTPPGCRAVPVDTTSDATVREGLGVIRERDDVSDVSLGMDYRHRSDRFN